MVTLTIDYLGRTKDEMIQVIHQAMEEVGAPTAPYWAVPLIDGDVMFINMAAVCQIRMTKGKIASVAS